MKGILYSGILIMVLFVMLSIMTVQSGSTSSERDASSLKDEIDAMDSSYRSIERSLHTISDVSLRRAVIVSQGSILNKYSYFSNGENAPSVLKRLMWNGSLSNQTNVSFMANNFLEYNVGLLEDYYSLEPRKYNVSISLDYQNSTIGLYDAFTIFFNATAEVNISKIGVANLSRKINVFEKVSVVGFEDSFYLINVTGGKESRIINRSRFMNNFTQRILNGSGDGNCYGSLTSNNNTDSKDHKIFFSNTSSLGPAIDAFCGVIFVSGSAPNTSYLRVNSISNLVALENQNFLLLGSGETWNVSDGLFNVSNFISHVHEGRYTNSSAAPSFFDILEGNTACTYCALYGPVGLETMIDKNRLLAPRCISM